MPINGMHSYPKIYNLGHAAIADLLKAEVIVEEKVDGSQISFSLREDGELFVRSKGAPVYVAAPEGMFAAAVREIVARKSVLRPGYVYRGEYLAKPKHNVLVYERTPKGHIVLFDVNPGEEQYLSPEEIRIEAAHVHLEAVPVLYRGMVENIDRFRSFLQTPSFLGGPLVEGVVVKPAGRNLWGADKKLLMGKFVSEAFKEVHAGEWKDANPAQGDILIRLGEEYRTPARWMKAIQHLKEAGKLEHSPRDIGPLIKEIPQDIAEECAPEIKEKLWGWAWPHVRRLVTRGMPEWYKEELLKRQFDSSPVKSEEG